ncbi:MAG: hypothetical protein V4502_03495 [Pseudomonadota bacterium]
MNDYDIGRAVNEKMQAAGMGAKIATGECGNSVEPPFRDRLQNRLHHARREAEKANRIEELLYLLDKQPEVARILELVEAVGK